MSEETKLPEPVTRGDLYLNVILNGNKDGVELPEPITRIEMYLKALVDKLGGEQLKLPEGGKEGQILALDADGNLSWIDAPSGGGDFLPLAGGTMAENAVIGSAGGELQIKSETVRFLNSDDRFGTLVYFSSPSDNYHLYVNGSSIHCNNYPTAYDEFTNKRYVDSVAVPAGGSAGQILAKKSNTNRDVEWIDAPTGGGSAAVSSKVWNLIKNSMGDLLSTINGVTLDGYAGFGKNVLIEVIATPDSVSNNRSASYLRHASTVGRRSNDNEIAFVGASLDDDIYIKVSRAGVITVTDNGSHRFTQLSIRVTNVDGTVTHGIKAEKP